MEGMKPGRTTPVGIIRVAIAATALIWLTQGIQAQSGFPPLAGDSALSSMPESADIRARLWSTVIAARPATVLALRPRTEANPWGSWRLSMDRGADAFYVSIIPARQTNPAAGGTSTGSTLFSYPQYAQGTWIIKRSSADGAFLQAKIFQIGRASCRERVYIKVVAL